MRPRPWSVVVILLVSLLAPAILRAQGPAHHLRAPEGKAAWVRAVRAMPTASPTRFLVTYREVQGERWQDDRPFPNVSAAAVGQAMARVRGRPGVRGARQLGSWPVAVVDVASPDAAAALIDDPNVDLIEPDQLHALPSLASADRWAWREGKATRDRIPYGVTMVGAPVAWSAGYRGQGVKVAILDSGGDIDHPDLPWAGGYNATATGGAAAWDDNISVCNGHGTHVAGTIGARDNGIGVVGVAPEAELYAIRVFEVIDGSCRAWTSSQIAGLNWAVQQGIPVVNASIGGSYTGSYEAAVYSARNAGTLLVGSSGNNGSTTIVSCPACYTTALAVGSVGSTKARSSFSNGGSGLDLMAPGQSVESTMPGGGTGTKSGTSMAAPHVAGVVALVLSALPDRSLTRALERIGATAEDLSTPGYDLLTGLGLVRADLAIGLAAPVPTQVSLPVGPFTWVRDSGATTALATQQASVVVTGDGALAAGWTAAYAIGGQFYNFVGVVNYGPRVLDVTPNPSAFPATKAPGVYRDTLVIRWAPSGVVAARLPVEVTIRSVGATTPITVTLSPRGQRTSVRADSAAPGGTVAVTLAGTNAATTSWTVTTTGRVGTLAQPGGTGNSTVTWTRRVPGVGRYIDTVTVRTSTGALGRFIDTLDVRAVPISLTITPAARARTLPEGSPAVTDSVAVTIDPATTPWTAVGEGDSLRVVTPAGTGSGWVRFVRTPGSAGLRIGRVLVRADTLVRVALDSMLVTPPPRTVTLAPDVRSRGMLEGDLPARDSVQVTLAGEGGDTATWRATTTAPDVTLERAEGRTGAWMVFTRGAGVPGTRRAEIVVVSGAASATYREDLTTVARPRTLTLQPAARARALVDTAAPVLDSVQVVLGGTGGETATWRVADSSGVALLTTTGRTAEWVRFRVAPAALGLAVRTFTIVADGVTAMYRDSVTTVGRPLMLALTPASRSRTITEGASPVRDSLWVALSGTGHEAAVWTATADPGLTLDRSTGTGSGWLRFTVAPAPSAGLREQVIRLTSGAGEARYRDTVVTVARPRVVRLEPARILLVRRQGDPRAVDSARVILEGSDSALASWRAEALGDLVLTPTGGSLQWVRVQAPPSAVVGSRVDSIRVTSEAASAWLLLESVTQPPAFAAALAPTLQRAVRRVGEAYRPQAALRLTGEGADTMPWRVRLTGPGVLDGPAAGRGNVDLAWRVPTDSLGWRVTQVAVEVGDTTVLAIDSLWVRPPALTASVAVVADAAPVYLGELAQWELDVTLAGEGADTARWALAADGEAAPVATGVGSQRVPVTRPAGAVGSMPVQWTLRVDTLQAAVATVATVLPVRRLVVTPVAAARTIAPSVSVADSAALSLEGTAAPGDTSWAGVVRRQTGGVTSASVEQGSLRWTAAALLPGEERVDSLWVGALGRGVDTGEVLVTRALRAADVPVTITVQPARRSYRVEIGTVVMDSAFVALSAPRTWTARAGRPWTIVQTTTGTGDGVVRWSSDFRNRAPGLFLDTVWVAVDSVVRAPVEIAVTAVYPTATLTLTPPLRRVRTTADTAARGDSLWIDAREGTQPLPWRLTASGSLRPSADSGLGGAWVRYTRAVPAEMTTGWLAGALQVVVAPRPSAPSGLTATFRDSVDLVPLFAPRTLAFVPTSRRRSLQLDSIGTWTEVALQVGGDGAATAAWRVTNRSAALEILDTVGVGSGTIRYRWAGITGAGTFVGRIQVSTATGEVVRAEFLDTLVVTVTPPPPTANPVLRVTPTQLATQGRLGAKFSGAASILVTPLNDPSGLARWRVRRISAARMVSISTTWRTGEQIVTITTSHGAKTPMGVYVDTLLVERADAMNAPVLVEHRLSVQPLVALQDVSFTHGGVTSRYWSVPAGTTGTRSTRFTVTPVGTGADTMLWQTVVRPGVPQHLSTGAGTSRGTRSILLHSALGQVPGIYVDTIVTAMVKRPSAQTRVLDTLEVVPTLSAARAMEPSHTLPLTIIPPLRGNGVPMVAARGIQFVAMDTLTWALTWVDAPIGRTALPVIWAAESPVPDEPSPMSTVEVIRLSAAPTLREAMAALGHSAGQTTLAGWLDALGDRDGIVTLADLVRVQVQYPGAWRR